MTVALPAIGVKRLKSKNPKLTFCPAETSHLASVAKELGLPLDRHIHLGH
jgi:hypothetical protein